jgi:hypothetical protein
MANRLLVRARSGSSTVALLLGIASFAVVAALIALSPLALRQAANSRSDWAELSTVGQVYQGATALLTGVAFAGVATSLLLQWHQTRVSQLVATRERHFELIKLALDDPRYFTVLGGELDPLEVYAHLMVSHWKLAWDLGELDDTALRGHAGELFGSPVSRKWWNTVRPYWASNDRRRSRTFVRIMNEAFEKALSDLAAATSPPETSKG